MSLSGDSCEPPPSNIKGRRGRPPGAGPKSNSGNNSASRGKSTSNSQGVISPNRYAALSMSDQGENESWDCENCKESFLDTSVKKMECKRCQKHFCIRCTNKSEAEYEAIAKMPDMMWFCPACHEIIDKI